MKKKVLITGLGYIGYEICHLLSTSIYDITVIDNQFYPDRVAWIVTKGIKFYQRDLFDLEDLLQDVDILIHTAGITSVPQTEKDSNPIIDEAIKKTGTLATRQIIGQINKKCKIIFLSTHVVFEGLTEQKFDLSEKYSVWPKLAYSTSKIASELDLFDNDKDFIILRLGSVFGYNDAIRWKIVANLFSKMAALDQKITAFGLCSIKPLVGISDCARAIIWLMESDYNRQIFNIVSENRTVNDIVDICEKYVPKLDIERKKDEIPSLGYSLSNKKILSTGFQFKQTLEEEIHTMIDTWKNNYTLIF